MGKTGVKRGKYKRYLPRDKEMIAVKAGKLTAEGLDITKIAKKLKVPWSTLKDIISNDVTFAIYKKRKRDVLETKMMTSLEKDLKAQEETRPKASHGALTMSLGTKWDKVYPPMPGLTQYNIGKDVDIEWKAWDKPIDTKTKKGDSV